MNKTRPDGLRYAAHVAIYPPCSQKILDYESTGAPMLIFIGKEDYNDATRCHDRVRELKAAGTQVELIEYPATYHCYLSSSSVKLVNTPVYRRCGIQVLKTKIGRMSREDAEVWGKGCVLGQGLCGGNPRAREDTLKRTLEFFSKHLSVRAAV